MPAAPEKIILGIDPGIATTGWGVISVKQTGDLSFIDCGCILTLAQETLSERLLTLHRELLKIIKKYRPNQVSVEELFFCKNVKTALIVGHARGVVLLTIKSLKIPLFEFTPLEIKQAVTSYGQADKNQVQQMVKLLLNLPKIPQPDDAADALAAAICSVNFR